METQPACVLCFPPRVSHATGSCWELRRISTPHTRVASSRRGNTGNPLPSCGHVCVNKSAGRLSAQCLSHPLGKNSGAQLEEIPTAGRTHLEKQKRFQIYSLNPAFGSTAETGGTSGRKFPVPSERPRVKADVLRRVWLRDMSVKRRLEELQGLWS